MAGAHRRITRRQRTIRAGLAAVLSALFLTGTGFSVEAALSPSPALAAGTPFTCNPSLYFQAVNSPTQLYREAYNASGGLTFTAIGTTTTLTYNALGYDPVDNFLYASTRNLGGGQEIVQLDATGAQTLLPAYTLPGSGFLAATFDPSGDYLATNDSAGGQQFVYSLNIAGGTTSETPMTLNGVAYTTALIDWTYSYGYLWAEDSATTEIVRVNPTTGVVIEIPQSYMPSGSYGAAWTFGNGNLVFSNNGTGEVYQLAVTNPTSATPTITGVSAAPGQVTSNNDGASCQGPPVDLGISKAGPASVAVSTHVSWTIAVTDDSAVDDSSGYSVEDPVPAGYTNVATTTAGCTVTGNNVVCVEPEIDAGATFTVTVTATSPAGGGVYTNTATVIGNEDDPNSSNNSSSVTTDVGFANVSLTKVATTTAPEVGAADTFTLTLTNSAASTAPSGQVVVTDTLSAGLAYASSASSLCPTGSCITVTAATVTWTVADLAPGASASLQITVDVDTSSPVTNDATFTQAFPNSTGGTAGTSNTATLDPAWANVSLTKAVTDFNPEVGADDIFTLTASSAGASTAGSGVVTVTDVLPVGLAYEFSTPSNSCAGACVSVAGQTVTWTIDNLAAGADATLQIVVKVTGTTSVFNVATFAQTVPNDTGGTTGSSNAVPVTPVYADVSVTKVATTTTPDLGTEDTFTLTATNSGPDSAGTVVVSDPVPAGLEIESASASLGSLGVSGQTVTWTMPDLASGETGTLSIVVTVNATTPVTNSASFTQETPNSSGLTSGTSNSVTLSPQWADVSLVKSVSSATPTVGSDDTFTLTASNAAFSTAGSGMVIVSDTLPAGLTYVSSTPSNSCTGPCVTYSEGTITWVVDDIFGGDSATLQIVVDVTSSAPSTNTATFTQSNPNDTGGTTGSSNTVDVTPAFADVTVQKSVSSSTPAVGAEDTFTLTAANDAESTSDSGEVVVTDTLPAGLTYVSSTPSNTCAGSCVSVGGQTVTWTIDDVSPGATATLQIVVTVTATTPVTNTASFTQTNPNGTGGTTGTSNSVTLTPGYAVVSLTKSASSTSPGVGTADTFTLTATNAGPDASGAVVVTDVLPTGLSYDSSSPSAGTVADAGPTVTWTIPDLTASGAGATATALIVVSVDTTATVTNTATFTQTTPNAVGGTTGTSNPVSLTPLYADVSLTKSASSATPGVGSEDTFTLTAANAGPDAAGKVVVTDVLASGLSYDSSSPSAGTVADAGQTVTWTIPDLTASGAGATATLQIVVTVNTSAKVTNTATFTQATPNSSGATRGSSNTVTLTPPSAAVTLTKSASSTKPALGSDDTFTLTAANAGPDASGKVVVTDILAKGLSYESSTPSAGSVSTSGQTVTWTIPDLTAFGAGDTATLGVVVQVDTTATVTNTASFTQTTPNGSGSTTGSSNTVTLVPSYAELGLTKTIADASPHVGTDGTYTITVTDKGPDTATDVVVTDPLPAALSYVSATTATGTATESSSNTVETVTWSVGSLDVGASATLSLDVRFTSAGPVVNIATATDSTFDRAGQVAMASAAANVEAPVVVPPAHTGEPWAGWGYWLLVSLLGAAGLAAFEGARRRRAGATR